MSFGVATFLGFASGAFVYFGMLSVGHIVTLATALREGFTDWYSWALLCPLVFLIARRLRIDRLSWPAVAALHLVVGTTVALVVIGIITLVTHRLAPEPGVGLSARYHLLVLREFHFAFMIYWVLVAGAHAFMYRREASEASELRSQLVQAQLDILRCRYGHIFCSTRSTRIATLTRARGRMSQ